MTSAKLLRLLRAEADQVVGIADRLRQAIETVADPTEAEAEVEAVRAAAEDLRAELAAAQAEAALAAAETELAAAIGQARAEADQRVNVAEVSRDQALPQAVEAEQSARLAPQEAARAQAAAGAETGRVRADAEKMPASFCAEAARDRDELRGDLRARTSAPNAKPMPTETNHTSCAPNPTTKSTRPPRSGRYGGPGTPPSPNPALARTALCAAYASGRGHGLDAKAASGVRRTRAPLRGHGAARRLHR